MQTYHEVVWDIVGACNAQCRYCPSGGKNLLGNFHKSQAGVLSPDDFKNALAFMTERGVISPDTTNMMLFNWGEPFLHPQFETMLRIVSSMGFTFSLSTNASVLKAIPVDTLWRLKELYFSIPGFSQVSYDKQHGFDFNTIRENIRSIVAPIRQISPNTKIVVVYHLYKFNQSEIAAAKAFCKELGISFWGVYVVNLLELALSRDRDYKETSEDLFLDEINEFKKTQPADWACGEFNRLLLDEYCNVTLCCGVSRFDPGFVVGNLYTVDFNTLTDLRRAAPICNECYTSGYAYLIHAPRVIDETY